MILFFSSFVFAAEDSLTILSPNYFNEQKNVYDDINYLKNEVLSFKSCFASEPENLDVKLICANQNQSKKLDVFKFDADKKNICYFSNFDLENSPCDDFSLEIKYEQKNKKKLLKRTFKKQKQSKLINYVISKDYETLSLDDVSYYLIVLSDLENVNSKLSQEVYDFLKEKRDNSKKCWEKSGSCDIILTSKILFNLKEAGFSTNSRLLEDGKTYLEQNLISNENNPTKFKIEIVNDYSGKNISEVRCELKIDDNSVRTYSFDDTTNILEKDASNKMSFVCDERVDTIKFSVYNLNDKIKHYEEFDDSLSFSYDFEQFSCVGNEGKCDFEASINALLVYGSTIENANLIDNYVSSLIIKDGSFISFNSEEEYRDSGMFLLYKRDDDLKNFLNFNQNNDGSWGSGSRDSKIVETAWSVLGLQKASGISEYVDDGKKWIYYNEPSNGWSSLEKNSLAYMAIKEKIKPYLKISSKNYIEKTTTFTIENPSIYDLRDLKLEFSSEIVDFISFSQNLGDLGGEESINFNVSLDTGFLGEKSGYLKITGIDGKKKKLDLLNLPINLKGDSPFDFVLKKYSVSEDYKKINVEVIPQIENLNSKCEYVNPFTNNKEEVVLTEKNTQIVILNDLLKTGNVTLKLICTQDDKLFEVEKELEVEKSEKAFEVAETEVLLEQVQGFSVNINSVLKDKQVLTIQVLGDAGNVISPVEENKIVAAEDSRDILFEVYDEEYLAKMGNLSYGEILISSDNGYTKSIPLKISLKPPVEESNVLLYSILGIFTAIVVLILIIRTIRQRRWEEEETSSNYNNQEEFLDLDDDLEFK